MWHYYLKHCTNTLGNGENLSIPQETIMHTLASENMKVLGYTTSLPNKPTTNWFDRYWGWLILIKLNQRSGEVEENIRRILPNFSVSSWLGINKYYLTQIHVQIHVNYLQNQNNPALERVTLLCAFTNIKKALIWWNTNATDRKSRKYYPRLDIFVHVLLLSPYSKHTILLN